MEFPSVGERCSKTGCQQLDFLPFNCSLCSQIFCKDHQQPIAHECTQLVDHVVSETKKTPNHVCSAEGCTTKDSVQMPCTKCSKHFCLSHRFHDCFTQPTKDRKAVKEQFKTAKEATDKTVKEKMANSGNRALANKIKLMRIKGQAVGDNKVPTTDRCFFAVAPPLENRESSQSKAIFISKTWTVGRAIDSIAKRLKLNNRNSEEDAPKLRLFSTDGISIADTMDVLISDLLANGTLIDGDSLILEFVPQALISEGAPFFNAENESRLQKYIFK